MTKFYHSVFDPTFNGMAASEYYRALVIPELYPNHETAPQPIFKNWDPDELPMYCGGEFGVRTKAA